MSWQEHEQASPQQANAPTGNLLQGAHSSCTGGSSPLCLLSPLIGANLGSWETTRSAKLVLSMETSLVASTANSVCLGVTLTKRRSTLGH